MVSHDIDRPSALASPADPQDDAPRPLSAAQFRVLVGLFVVSGGAGLVDQVCFSKYLSYIVGATAYAVSAVLAAFMTGLALGAALAGRFSSRIRRPLVAYGVAELVVALTVVFTPLAFSAFTPVYVGLARGLEGSVLALSFVRWAMATVIVIVPTVAMGATLPLVAVGLARVNDPAATRTRERRLTALYAANTLGGAIGALGAAYLVLPVLGLSGTVYAAAAASAVAGTVAIVLARKQPGGAESPGATPVPAVAVSGFRFSEGTLLGPGWLYVLAFASGYLVFTVEVVATHLLAVIVGNSAYAFGLILAAFLVCLFFGALLAPGFSRALGAAALPTSLGVAALALAVVRPLWDELPLVFAGLGEHITSFAGREAMRAAVAFGGLVAPATAMGLTFPLLLRWAARRPEVAQLVGRLTAINTVGAVTGALATGYLVLPALGSERTLLAVGLVFAGLGVGTAWKGLSVPAARLWPFAFAGSAAILSVAWPPWDLRKLTAGTNVYFDEQEAPDAILHVQEDVHGGITTVTLREGVHTLYTNGKFQGNDGWELHAQRYFAHYPALFVNDFDRALVIGLGTGTTLGTLAAYPWRKLDVVEISPAIVQAAQEHFTGPNRGALRDPRVTLNLDDARNYLLVNDHHRYDLISMELSSVWFAGASALYSAEFYRSVHRHLKKGGVFQQWVQLHHVETPVFAALLHTLRREFAHVILFYGGGQGILIASEQPLRWSRSRAERLSADTTMREVLPDGRKLEELTRDILVLDAGLDRFLADTAAAAGLPLDRLVSTDDNLLLEYRTPRGNVLPWSAREALVARLKGYRDLHAIAALSAP